MTSQKTRISTDLDFERPGKQISYLRLVHSDDRHSFGVIPVPIACLSNGKGPTVFLSAGNHGNEYEGQIVLHDLIRNLDPRVLNGRLIVMPALNYPAVLGASRTSPIDHLNFNRVFPGDPAGSPSLALAHYVETEILPRCQAAADLHSGNPNSRYVLCAYLHGGGSAEFVRRKIAAARIFGAPWTIVAKETSNTGSMTAACDRLGVLMVSTELGGGGTIDRHNLAMAKAGLMRLLHHYGVLPTRAPQEHFSQTRLLVPRGGAGLVMVPTRGLLEPCCEPGDRVAAGDLAGRLWSLDELDQPARELRFAQDGIVCVRRVHVPATRGDHVAQVASEVSEAELIG